MLHRRFQHKLLGSAKKQAFSESVRADCCGLMGSSLAPLNPPPSSQLSSSSALATSTCAPKTARHTASGALESSPDRLHVAITSEMRNLAIRPSNTLLAPKAKPNMMTYEMGLSTDLDELGKEVDLGEDNLNLSAIEEYSKEDMEMRAQQMIALYNSSVFAFCFYPSVDVVYLMNDLDLLPPIRPEASVAHWMADPQLILRQPRILADVMGQERWGKLSSPLAEMAENLNEFSPLVRCLRKHKLPRAKWLPFLRQLAVEETTTIDKTLIPAMALSMSNGRLPEDWMLPTDSVTNCTQVVCEILLSTAAETGALSIATVACRIIRLHQIAMTFPLQKLLMCALSAHARRRLDWDARVNGALTTAVANWRQQYFKTVEHDLDLAASGMADLGAGLGDTDEEFSEESEEEDEDEDTVDGAIKKKRLGAAGGEENEDGLQAYEDRLASNVGISPTEYDDDGIFEGASSEVSDEGVEERRKRAELAGLKKIRGVKALVKSGALGDGSEEDEDETDEIATMSATDDALEGIGGGGGTEFDEEEDEDVFVDPATKANVSTYFTSGSHLTRAQSLSSSSKSKVMEKKQQRRDETMRRRLLGRITSQMVKGKKTAAAKPSASSGGASKRGRKKAA